MCEKNRAWKRRAALAVAFLLAGWLLCWFYYGNLSRRGAHELASRWGVDRQTAIKVGNNLAQGNHLVGLSGDDLIVLLGPPHRTSRAGEKTYLEWNLAIFEAPFLSLWWPNVTEMCVEFKEGRCSGVRVRTDD
jgi:hypothetical protein